MSTLVAVCVCIRMLRAECNSTTTWFLWLYTDLWG